MNGILQVITMDTDKKVPADLYKTYGELFSSKTMSTNSEPVNSAYMLNKLQNVRSLATLDDNKINSLLHALDEL